MSGCVEALIYASDSLRGIIKRLKSKSICEELLYVPENEKPNDIELSLRVFLFWEFPHISLDMRANK